MSGPTGNNPIPNRPKVVILGGGFGGLTAARALDSFADVTLIDRHNFQTFLPLLYQVSTAGLAGDHVAYPIRGALRKTQVDFRMGSPISIDHKNKSIKLDSSETFNFDYLVFALGSVTNDFGIKGVNEHALGMKSVQDALHIRSTILRYFEDLCRFNEKSDVVINIVGGGSANELLNQLTADATGLKVISGPTEATALGNLIVQFIALGLIKDLDAGRELIRASVVQKTFLPNK